MHLTKVFIYLFLISFTSLVDSPRVDFHFHTLPALPPSFKRLLGLTSRIPHPVSQFVDRPANWSVSLLNPLGTSPRLPYLDTTNPPITPTFGSFNGSMFVITVLVVLFFAAFAIGYFYTAQALPPFFALKLRQSFLSHINRWWRSAPSLSHVLLVLYKITKSSAQMLLTGTLGALFEFGDTPDRWMSVLDSQLTGFAVVLVAGVFLGIWLAPYLQNPAQKTATEARIPVAAASSPRGLHGPPADSKQMLSENAEFPTPSDPTAGTPASCQEGEQDDHVSVIVPPILTTPAPTTPPRNANEDAIAFVAQTLLRKLLAPSPVQSVGMFTPSPSTIIPNEDPFQNTSCLTSSSSYSLQSPLPPKRDAVPCPPTPVDPVVLRMLLLKELNTVGFHQTPASSSSSTPTVPPSPSEPSSTPPRLTVLELAKAYERVDTDLKEHKNDELASNLAVEGHPQLGMVKALVRGFLTNDLRGLEAEGELVSGTLVPKEEQWTIEEVLER
ncbi:hypothetical protein C8R43DRAFT_1209421 [Mycena crocata]|nr:hypothetical protein C8R43DRAFT_1209421 [Mycena crocata]